MNVISNELFVPKSLIMIPIERFSLSTFSGCYTERERVSWCNECKRAREEGKEQETEERKRISKEKKKEKEIAKKREGSQSKIIP